MIHKILHVFFGERINKEDLGFIVVKIFLITTIQELDNMQWFMEVSVNGLRGHVLRFFLSPMHALEGTIASEDGASGRCNMIKKHVAHFEEGVGLVHSIIVVNMMCFLHGLSSGGLIICIMQNMLLVIGTQLFNQEVVEVLFIIMSSMTLVTSRV